MMIGVSVIAAPLLFALLHLLIIFPWYWVLLESRLLSFVSLYFASAFSVFVLWLFGLRPEIPVTFKEATSMAIVISVAIFVVVALFWGFSYPDDSDKKQS